MFLPSVALPHRIIVEPYKGHAAEGPVYGPPTGVPARVEARRRTVRRQNAGPDVGTDAVSTSTATVRPRPWGATIPAESRVTLPADVSPTGSEEKVEILRVDVGQGLRRPAYVEWALG